MRFIKCDFPNCGLTIELGVVCISEDNELPNGWGFLSQYDLCPLHSKQVVEFQMKQMERDSRELNEFLAEGKEPKQ